MSRWSTRAPFAAVLLAACALACPTGRPVRGGVARPVPAGPAVPAAPETLAVAWTAEDRAAAIDQGVHPFALFPDDGSEGDLAHCREARMPEESSDPEQPACAYGPTGVLAVGGAGWWLGLYTEHSEWDGMTSLSEDVVFVVPGDAAEVRHTVRQYDESIVDCGTTILGRRRAVLDLDGDGRVELCIEEVRETGPGLFELLDLADRGAAWVPFFRRRTRTAWTADDGAGRLVRAAALDASCPAEGYAEFVAPATEYAGGPLAGRRALQGEQPVAPCTAAAAEAAGCGEGYCDDPEAPAPVVVPPEPYAGSIRLEGDRLVLPDMIAFEIDKAVLRPGSLAVLREAAAFLLASPEVGHVRVELRQAPVPEADRYRGACVRCDRARSVREALVDFGVDPGRLSAHWEAADELEVGEAGPVRIEVTLRVVDCETSPACCGAPTACMAPDGPPERGP